MWYKIDNVKPKVGVLVRVKYDSGVNPIYNPLWSCNAKLRDNGRFTLSGPYFGTVANHGFPTHWKYIR